MQTSYRVTLPEFPLYIAVEGPIGVGKTILTKRLAARLQGTAYFEQFEDNPFLENFYSDPKRYAFQTEMFFLLSRYQQQEGFEQVDLFHRVRVCDFLFEKSRLFASLTLSDHELAMYDRLYNILSPMITAPDLILYLRAPVDTLMHRIQSRGREMEDGMDRDYIDRLSRLYGNYFKRYDRQPVLFLDTESVNYAEDGTAVDALVEEIKVFWTEYRQRVSRQHHRPLTRLNELS